MTEHHIGTVEDFPAGQATKVEIDGIPISVFNIDGSFYGIHNICIHKNLPMDKIGDEAIVSSELKEDGRRYTLGEIDEETLTIRCPWHNLEWDLETGTSEVLGRSISTFDVEARGDDVYLTF